MPRVDVDLHAARLALLGQELRVREARADHQQRVAVRHQLPARLACRAGRSSRSRTAGRRAATALPSSALATPAPSSVGDLRAPRRRRRARPRRPASRPARRRSGLGGALAGRRRRARRAAASSRRRSGRCRARAAASRTASIACDVVRDDQAGDGALRRARSGSARSTRCRICAGVDRHLDVLVRDVLEQRDCRSTSCW